MRAGSAAAYKHAHEHVEQQLGSSTSAAQYRVLGDQFLLLADTVGDSAKLAESLTSTTRSTQDKVTLIDAAFSSMEPLVVSTLKELSAQTWSEPRDFAEACEDLGMEMILKSAGEEGNLEKTQDDLFQMDQVIRNNRQLRDALVTHSQPLEKRLKLADDVFSSSVSDVALLLFHRVLSRAHNGRIIAGVGRLRRVCAQAQGKELAIVQTAQPLSDEQYNRLSKILTEQSGRPVTIDVVNDPSVIGGMRIRMGADLYEGTLAASLHQARTRLAG